jgi:hypothetical protein
MSDQISNPCNKGWGQSWMKTRKLLEIEATIMKESGELGWSHGGVVGEGKFYCKQDKKAFNNLVMKNSKKISWNRNFIFVGN